MSYADEAREILDWFAEHRDPADPQLFQEEGRKLTKDMLDGTWTRASETAGLPVGQKEVASSSTISATPT